MISDDYESYLRKRNRDRKCVKCLYSFYDNINNPKKMFCERNDKRIEVPITGNCKGYESI